MIDVQLDLFADQSRSLHIAEQFSQGLSVGGVNDQGTHLPDAGHPFLSKGQHILVFFASLQGDGTVPKTGDGKDRFYIIVNIFGTQVFGFPHLAKPFIASKLAEFIFGHHS
jgi:hypothetical protein